MIEAHDLHKTFDGTPVLDGASFAADPGTATVLVGPNGSGKTTTLHVLAGLVTPDAGTARINGVDVTTDRTAAQEQLAFLPQDVRFHDALTPRQVLRFYAGLRPGTKTEGVGAREGAAGRIEALLEQVALREAADRSCETLSGGMRQRVGIALLELADAPVLLLDEPGLSLDPEWRSFLMGRLREHVRNGATVLMTTHLIDVWRPLADRVLRCEGGRIQPDEESTPVAEPSA